MSSPHSPEPVIEETVCDQSPSPATFDERNIDEEELFPSDAPVVHCEPARMMDEFERKQLWDDIDDELQFKYDVGEVDNCAHQPAIEKYIPRVSPIALVPEVQPSPECHLEMPAAIERYDMELEKFEPVAVADSQMPAIERYIPMELEKFEPVAEPSSPSSPSESRMTTVIDFYQPLEHKPEPMKECPDIGQEAMPRIDSYDTDDEHEKEIRVPECHLEMPAAIERYDMELEKFEPVAAIEMRSQARYREPAIAREMLEPAIEMENLLPQPKFQLLESRQETAVESRQEEAVEEDLLMDAIDSGEKEGDRLTMKDREDFERDIIDKTLEGGDLDEITDLITPYNLMKCKTNSLEKSLEVSHKLKSLADRGGPDSDDFDSLATTVEDFAIELLKPLKRDDMRRAIFEGDSFDQIAEKIVVFRQKKFVSHPVVYNLLMRRWAGMFYHLRYSSFASLNWFKWLLLNLWTVFDLVLFPLAFTILHVIHRIKRIVRHRRDHSVVLVLNSTWKKEYLKKMRNLSNDILGKCNQNRIKFASIFRNKDGIITNTFLAKDEARTAVKNETCKIATDNNTLQSCLKNGKEMLKEFKAPNSNKTLVLMTDDIFGESFKTCLREAQRVKSMGFRMVCVGLGVHLDIKQLESMTTDGKAVLYHGDIKQEDVCQKLLQGIHGQDVYDRYLEYFQTPYFIFVRDTLSYLALLVLHCIMCLEPSTRRFITVEWVILFFFLGRLSMEIHQAVMEKQLGNEIQNTSLEPKKNLPEKSEHSTENTYLMKENSVESDGEGEEVKIIQPIKPRGRSICQVLFRIFSRYFSDWWNVLDLITLIVYVVILILRSITWAEDRSVSRNRLLAVAGYFYGLDTMFLTLRVFGHIMESKKYTGSIQIALFQIIGAVVAIFGQFLAAVLAFSLAITKVYVAEMSYSTGTNSTSHGFCENGKGGIVCWWSSATHLLWSLLGIAELDPLQSTDGPSDVLAKLLYGAFLIMAAVMMMNMMIALLSNTYQKVEDNAFYEWSYRKATTIRTYVNYHPVPVPFNIISLTCLFIWHIYQRSCCKTCCQKDNSKSSKTKGKTDEVGARTTTENKAKDEDKGSFFDCLVYDLQADYLAAHGYEFPMTDSSKMDLLMKETEGSHQLIGHIASQVYKYSKKENIMLREKFGHGPYIWDTAGVDVKGHQLTYVSGPCTCFQCFTKSPEEPPKHHGAQFQLPLSKECPGFEVLIQEIGDRHFIAIGVVCRDHDLHKFPGWEGNAAGYHVDDGRIYDRQNPKIGRECKGAIAQRGDLIGCKILFDEQSKAGSLPVSITLNGRIIGQATVKGRIKLDGNWTDYEFFPFIGIGWEGVTVLFKLLPQEGSHSCKRDDSAQEDLLAVRRGINDLHAKLSGLGYLQMRVDELSYDVRDIKDDLKSWKERNMPECAK